MGGYWALRALVFGMCATILVVLIATACTQDPAVRLVSPTLIPSLTLTLSLNRALSPPFATLPPLVSPPAVVEPVPLVYLAQEHETLNDISANFGLTADVLKTANPQFRLFSTAPLTAGQTVIIPQATPNADNPALVLDAPYCVPTEPENLLCLGSVLNTQAQAISGVTLRVMLTRDDETVVAQIVTLEQRIINPQQRAAYAVRFTLPPRVVYRDATVTLVAAQTLRDAPVPPVEIAPSPPRILNGRYVFSAIVTNPDSLPAESVRVYVTVYDDRARVVGYRVVALDRLEANATRALAFDVPLVSSDGSLRLVMDSEVFEP